MQSVVANASRRPVTGNLVVRASFRLHQLRSFTSLNSETPYNICFLRHGQSTWNRDNRFIGWTDTPLTEDGILEARAAGSIIRKSGMMFDEVHTSLLRRSIRTVNIVLMETGQEYIPVSKSWRLNERSYGDLVGHNKKDMVKKFGKDQVKRWRRSYNEPPPPMAPDHPYHPKFEPRYRDVRNQVAKERRRFCSFFCTHFLFFSKSADDPKIPLSESLKDTVERSSVYWDRVIAPSLKEGKTLLVVGHENNLRSILMRLEGIHQDDMIHLSLPRSQPLAYRLDEETLEPLDSTLDGATGFLRGHWLGGDQTVAEILDRDHKQVYDTTIEHNLETESSQWKTTLMANKEAHAEYEEDERKVAS
eukprot:CAMPEP_0116845936 /NCGR_PEP_ID=MMETSP0418-20121206/13560_1 /TAXON_ID=1158023 /ORGANISM="Astrosyne radiata, Strain 13vi08-1A" /LENGTH=360 /DNA_ID=CAMNT_0004477135 /DNA_START=182 /DNA_END=1265 /DNA_ORIENTATION=-